MEEDALMGNDRQLRDIVIKESARDVLSQYCLALDLDDRDLLRGIFSENAVLKHPPDPDLVGREAVLEFFNAALNARVDHRKHFNSNVMVEVDDAGRAAGSAYFFALHSNKGLLSLAWGSYKFSVRVINGVGVIDELTIDVDVPISPVVSMLGSSC